MLYDIIIVGAGWYGCHIALSLKDTYHILILEKSDDIFNGASYYNQNRLHLGYHYSRDYDTRNLCKQYYDEFKKEYSECIDEVDDNYYVISKDSMMCHKTYKSIFTHEGFDFSYEESSLFTHIQGQAMKVNEKVINSTKAKKMMQRKLDNVEIIFNIKVEIIEDENIVTVNEQYHGKLLLDCTYNQLNLHKSNYVYELTLSLLYEKKESFGAITVMDGNFCSLYPREGNIYTLTDVQYTPIKKSVNFNEISSHTVTEKDIDILREKMESKMSVYFCTFLEKFTYMSYFLSYKTKSISNSDSRNICINKISPHILSVNCGKIYGIFEWQKYVTNHLDTHNF